VFTRTADTITHISNVSFVLIRKVIKCTHSKYVPITTVTLTFQKNHT
jgi:hypothetical protein